MASLELVEQVTASAGAVRAAMSDFQNVDNALTPHDAAPPVVASPPAVSAGVAPEGTAGAG